MKRTERKVPGGDAFLNRGEDWSVVGGGDTAFGVLGGSMTASSTVEVVVALLEAAEDMERQDEGCCCD